MTATNIYIIFLVLLAFEFCVSSILSYLNKKNWKLTLPDEVKEVYNEEEYKKSMKYEQAKYSFWKISTLFSSLIIFLLVWFGIFWKVCDFIANFWFHEIITNLIFLWILLLSQTILNLPFAYYSTFVIEQKFWFNKSTKKLFFIDTIKTFLLGVVIWWIIFALLNYFYILSSSYFWLFAWIFITLFSIFMILFHSSLIVPLYNKQTPLPEWELKEKITSFAKTIGFTITDIFVIDWSKRSTKANAYFSGFWPKKRIVLFDTLIKDLTHEELVAVLAHELGHYKKRHILQMFIFSVIQSWIIFFILGLILANPVFANALGSSWNSFILWILAFSIIFSPVSMILWVLWNILSRKNEYEADDFSAKTYNSEALRNALIKLSKNNLANLTPHKAYEFFYYSHPGILKRLKALKKD